MRMRVVSFDHCFRTVEQLPACTAQSLDFCRSICCEPSKRIDSTAALSRLAVPMSSAAQAPAYAVATATAIRRPIREAIATLLVGLTLQSHL